MTENEYYVKASYQNRAITGHGCSSKDDISKKDSDQARQWSKNKTTGNEAYRYRLEKISGTWFSLL